MFAKFYYWIDLTHVYFCVGAVWYTQMTGWRIPKFFY